MTINLLPSTLINQIAAGEVIDRPSSVVKELVENALDAKATAIDVRIRGGGKVFLSITDNGHGMPKEDLRLCIKRHATSKMSHGNLFNIETLGFRGEALPSIGSVSRLKVTSRARDQHECWSLEVQGGEESPLTPSSGEVGTKIDVRDLFYATPARLKFLKSDSTEWGHIQNMIQKFALAHHHVSFRVYLDNTLKAHYTQSQDRLLEVMGQDFMDNSFPIEITHPTFSMQGRLSLPSFSRANTLQQFLFVNGRFVKDRVLQQSLRMAYQDLLVKERFPVAVLFLKVPSESVDVNVHPAKTEIRFMDETLVRRSMVTGLKEALQKHARRPVASLTQKALSSFQAPEKRFSSPHEGYASRAAPSTNPWPSIPKQASPWRFPLSTPSVETSKGPFLKDSGPTEMWPKETSPMEHPPSSTEGPSPALDASFSPAFGLPKAQLFDTFIVCEDHEGITLIDQHAVHERLVYETLKEDFFAAKVTRQALLIPEVIDVPESQRNLLETRSEELRHLGLVLEVFSPKSVLVREVPALLKDHDIPALIRDLADQLEEMDSTLPLKERLSEVLSTMACHGSIRAGKKMTFQEMLAFIQEMEKNPFTGQCNHGRPTFVKMSRRDLEKLFDRT